jgi:hypothetical protein
MMRKLEIIKQIIKSYFVGLEEHGVDIGNARSFFPKPRSGALQDDPQT